MQQPLERLRVNATTCRDLAETAITPAAREVLANLAEAYERKALDVESSGALERRARPAFHWALS